MLLTENERPELDFNTLGVHGMGSRQIIKCLYEIYGRENYEIFRKAGKKQEDIPEEVKQAVNRRVYDQAGERFGVQWGRGLWTAAMLRSNETVDCARGVLLPDQDRVASLTTNIAWSTNEPWRVLERLTKPSEFIGPQLRAEQLRQLALAAPCAEEIIADNGDTRDRLTSMNDFLEKEFFIGKSGDTKEFHIFSYHTPGTNKLVGLSDQYPDSRFTGLWVKSLSYEVREVGIRDQEENIEEIVQVLYEQREKNFGKRIIKGIYKSKKDTTSNGKIEVVRHVEDPVGFRLVVMRDGHSSRDRVTEYLDLKLRKFFGLENIKDDDSVDPDNGKPDRFPCRRKKVFEKGSSRPILEVIIQSLGNYIDSEHEIGKFDPNLGMHDGSGHPFHDLKIVAAVAPDLWPRPPFRIKDIPGAVKRASMEYATRLARVDRIDPPPYEGLELV